MKLVDTYISEIKPSPAAASAVSKYCAWQTGHYGLEFVPTADDDVDLRSYLFHLHTSGTSWDEITSRFGALKQFYFWAKSTGVITRNPFEDFEFDQLLLAVQQAALRQPSHPEDMQKREIERLHALSQIAEVLNKSVDINAAITNTLEKLLEVMDLHTGWVSMLNDSHFNKFPGEEPLAHGFTLAAAVGLPPSLERDDCRLLRQPPACHCQQLLNDRRMTRPVNIVECSRLRGLDHTDNQGLRFHASVPLISRGKSIGLINVATNDWQFISQADLHFLSAVSEQLVIALERAHFYEVAESRRLSLEEELQVAREVQTGLMPHKMPGIPGYDLAFAWCPALAVGGDFYNIFPVDKGRWGLMIGDVAGKGTASALYMTMIHSLILSGLLRNPSIPDLIAEVNHTVLKQISSVMFVSVFLAVLDPVENTLQYVNAGHNPPFVRRASGTLEVLSGTGGVVGLFVDQQWNEGKISLGAGDSLVLYTDGVTEAKGVLYEFYGEDRLAAAINTAPRKANQLLEHLEADLNTFSADTEQDDDITLLVLTKN